MLTLTPIPAFQDNYIWLLDDGRHALVVDPGDAASVIAALNQRDLVLTTILITHHHHDHTGGIAQLAAHYSPRVIGPATIQGITEAALADQTITIAQPASQWQVFATPGHTQDHLSYFDGEHLFCGDTLFACGCGRLFEGSPADMLASLQRLAALPAGTLICPAHEYTLSNQRFALAAEPDNLALQQRHQRDIQRREQQHPTVPVSLAEELASNPFLRAHRPTIQATVSAQTGQKLTTELETFAALREWKNHF